MDKYEIGISKNGSYHGGSNIHLNLITCEDKIVNPWIAESSVLYLYHAYLIHPGMGRT